MFPDYCTGNNCPLKFSCYKYLNFMSKDNIDEDEEILDGSSYKNGKCFNYIQKEYYGG